MRIAVILLIWLTSAVHAEENDILVKMLAVGKLHGTCSTLANIGQFQSGFKSQDVAQFLIKFNRLEAAKLGLSVDELSVRCQQAQVAYQEFLGLANDSF